MNTQHKHVLVAIRKGYVVQYLKKKASRKFVKAVFYFLKIDDGNKCWIEITDKEAILGDGEKMYKVPCLLSFDWGNAYIDRIQNTLLELSKCNSHITSRVFYYSNPGVVIDE